MMSELSNSFIALRFKHRIKIRFLLVGVWNTIFGYGVFCLFDSFFAWLFSTRSIAYMSAMIIAQILAVINAYIFHKYITFQSAVKGLKMIAEFFRFSATYIVTFCLSFILLPLFVEIGNMHPKIAAAIIILICTVISYLGHSRFSFSKLA